MKRFRTAATVGLALLVLHASALAQVATGNIRGVVVDTTDAVIARVKITLTNIAIGAQRVVTTNDSGDFNAPFMPLGDYQIAAFRKLTGSQTVDRPIQFGLKLLWSSL